MRSDLDQTTLAILVVALMVLLVLVILAVSLTLSRVPG